MRAARFPAYATLVFLAFQVLDKCSVTQASLNLLLPEECEALAEQPVVKRFLGIDVCELSLNNCTKCDDGMVINFRDGRVISLNIPYIPVMGSLPDEWSVLRSLSSLSLMVDARTQSSLPEAWSELRNLSTLTLSNGAIYGSLPREWSTLTRLSILRLGYNELDGNLPKSWSALVSLADLDLGGNELDGTLPTEWDRMSHLTSLKLADNELHGTLPPDWGKLKKLASLDLKTNFLEGQLPPEWGTMEALASLHLGFNHFTGTVPEVWSDLSHLMIMTLGNNSLCGSIPMGRPLEAAEACAKNKWPGATASLPPCLPVTRTSQPSGGPSRPASSLPTTVNPKTALGNVHSTPGNAQSTFPKPAPALLESAAERLESYVPQDLGRQQLVASSTLPAASDPKALWVHASPADDGPTFEARTTKLVGEDLPLVHAAGSIWVRVGKGDHSVPRQLYMLLATAKTAILGVLLFVMGGLCGCYWYRTQILGLVQLADLFQARELLSLSPKDSAKGDTSFVLPEGNSYSLPTPGRPGAHQCHVVKVVLPYKGE